METGFRKKIMQPKGCVAQSAQFKVASARGVLWRPHMIRIALAAALFLLPLAAHAQQNEPFKPGLGEITSLQQMRHLKLWLAAQAGNWALADYELDELKEGFEDITKYYP